jgi:hypothetical protein
MWKQNGRRFLPMYLPEFNIVEVYQGKKQTVALFCAEQRTENTFNYTGVLEHSSKFCSKWVSLISVCLLVSAK